MKVFYPSDHPEGTTEMKGIPRDWSQLQFPKQCANFERDVMAPLAAASTQIDSIPPPALITAPPALSKYRPDKPSGHLNTSTFFGIASIL